MTTSPLPPEAVEAATCALAWRIYGEFVTPEQMNVAEHCVREVIQADRLALAEAGRLLPEGCERACTYAVRWYYPDAKPLIWGCETLAEAEGMTPPRDAVRGEVLAREQWTSPYVVVDQESEKQ